MANEESSATKNGAPPVRKPRAARNGAAKERKEDGEATAVAAVEASPTTPRRA
jgi:hypothetical protein